MRALDVFRDERLVGQLRETDGEIEFEYASEYLRHQGRPISASLPLEPSRIQGSRVRAYFGNLLPEGDLRATLSQQFKIDPADDVGMLARVGADCAGALVILPAGQVPTSAERPFNERYLALEDDVEFGQLIEALQTSPVASFKGVPTRLSLAGAQTKTAIARFHPDPTIYRSLGGATTHIVKFGSARDARGRELFPRIVFNELFCARLAAACGILTRPTELMSYRTFREGPPEYVYCIQRYDRASRLHHRSGGPLHSVERLHQEDFCQALGKARFQKYEAEDGISLQAMFAFVSDPAQTIVPARARASLLELVLFNLLIGNRDSHAKNYSLMRSGFKADLAPAYDLVCTDRYPGVDRTLPQRFGDAWKIEEIAPGDVRMFADSISLQPRVVLRQLAGLSARLLDTMPKIRESLAKEPWGSQAQDELVEIESAIGANLELARGWSG